MTAPTMQMGLFGPITLPQTARPRLALRPYQGEAIEAIHQAYAAGTRRPLVVLPTGTGKTVLFAHLISQRLGRSLVLAHRDELLQQAADKIRLVDPGATVGLVKAERDEVAVPIVVGSVQTLAQPARLARLVALGGVETIIVDEAHHATAPSYLGILERLGAFRADGPLTLGVTATPDRADQVGLGAVFQSVVYERSLLEMIHGGYLVDLRAIQVAIRANLDAVRTVSGDLVASETSDALLAADAPEHIVTAYQQYAPDRKALVFTPTVDLAHTLADTFLAAGVPAAAIDGAMPIEQRRDILRRLTTGDLRVVCNCAVLTEGFDEPSVSCVVIARPTKSRSLYTQMIGRGTRQYPGKTDCLILDVVGVSKRHQLQTAASLFGLEPRALEGGKKTVTAAIAEQQAAMALPSPAGQLVSEAVGLFDQRRYRWLAAGDAWALSVTSGFVLLEPDAVSGTWSATRFARKADMPGYQTEPIIELVPAEYAIALTEEAIRRSGESLLSNRDARWLSKPASIKQVEALAKWRIPAPAGLTAGEASDLMTQAIATRTRRARARQQRQEGNYGR